MNFEWKEEWLPLLAIVGTFAVSILFYPQLPDTIPTHWNAAGQPDSYSPRLVGAFLMPVIMLGVYLLLLFLPRIDPRRTNIERFSETYTLLRIGMTLFFAYIHGVILYTVLSNQETLTTGLIFGGVGVLLMLIGNHMPRMRSNWFMGIRTPWTLSSDSVWQKTHRLGGKLFMLAGFLILLAPFFDPSWTFWVMMVAIVLSGIVPIIYSYFLYQQEQGPSQA
ncbi:MAG: SdpI family protein [Ardenticatenaceae bacterium]